MLAARWRRSGSVLIEARGITKLFPVSRTLFGAATRYVHALDNVDLTIEKGRTLALVGESGSGKTTLGRIIAGLIEPTSGSVMVEGTNLTEAPLDVRRKLRREIQFVFQDPFSSLNPRHTIRTILARPFEVHTRLSRAEIDVKIKELLEAVLLHPPEALMHRYPHQFSGGQRQRIVFARAIALHPAFIVADEPVSSLDMSVKAQLLTLLQRFQTELSLTYLFITHELAVVRTIAQDVAVMYLGRIVERAPVSQLFDGPLHPYTQALLEATPILDPRLARERKRIKLHGTMPSPVSPPPGCHFHTRCPFAQAICHEIAPPLRPIGARAVACHFVGDPGFPLTAHLTTDLQPAAASGALPYTMPKDSAFGMGDALQFSQTIPSR
jgi:oligopeptide/dipeptide ABC transporter ATP-binding protein